MADKTITFSKSIVAQKDISEYYNNNRNKIFITQLSKPIILKGVSTKTCQNVLYSIDGMNFTPESTIGSDNVLSMAIVPFQLGGADIDSQTAWPMSKSTLNKAFSYILGGRNVNEDVNITWPASRNNNYETANGAYRYLLQYLADNKDKIEWDTGDLFSALDAGRQDSFGGSDFMSQKIPVNLNYDTDNCELSIATQSDANGSILQPSITWGKTDINTIKIKQSPYFFLYPEACPDPGSSQKLIIDNFWRGGGLLLSNKHRTQYAHLLILFIFAVS